MRPHNGHRNHPRGPEKRAWQAAALAATPRACPSCGWRDVERLIGDRWCCNRPRCGTTWEHPAANGRVQHA